MPSWIKFIEVEMRDYRKTRQWAVLTENGRVLLGEVKWYTAWRKYAFWTRPALLEEDCLREIAGFCERRTAERKSERKTEKEAAEKEAVHSED